MKTNFTPFFFDTNMTSGYCESATDWMVQLTRFKKSCPNLDPYLCKSAKLNENNFGLYQEHCGNTTTLREFFTAHNMEMI